MKINYFEQRKYRMVLLIVLFCSLYHFQVRMSDLSSLESQRAKGKTVVKAIVFGNESKYFGKKRESDGHTHEWTVYVKPYIANEDQSAYIKKVTFKLHESYTDALRVCSKPPYEVSETGWGEFEVIVKIYFVDSSERPVSYIDQRIVLCLMHLN